MSHVEVMNGNRAAGIAACLARPDVIAAYPITPQSSVVEFISRMIAEGKLDAKICEVESEHSAMSVLEGASLAGARTFSATSSQGLALMYEPYFRASTLRLPIVMAIANREMISPQTLWASAQDSLSVRDAGWMQFYAEDNQEILDTLLQAFRIAEDSRVLLPINVCYDGFYLSHMSERVVVPDAEEVDAFLPDGYDPEHIVLDPDRPMAVDPLTNGDLLTEYRAKHLAAQQAALQVIEEVDAAFSNAFGRSWDGAVEPYRIDEGCQAIVVTLGSMTGAGREAVDRLRDDGEAVGLLKIRAVRPFPAREVREQLAGVPAVGVVDRNVSFGWNTGIIYQEVSSALYGVQGTARIPIISGLGGEDITVEMFEDALRKILVAGRLSSERRDETPETIWLRQEKEGGAA